MKHALHFRFLSLLVSAVLVACGGGSDGSGGSGSGGATDAKPMDLTILHISDHHSSLDSGSLTLRLKNDAGARGRARVSVDAGGFPRVTAAIESLAAQSANVIKLHAGDAVPGSLYTSHAGAYGEADAAMMNTVCFDAFTLGNHEFDKGDSKLKGFIDLLHQGTCKTPVLSANVKFGMNSALNAAKAPGYVNKSVVVQRGGQSIGLVGLTVAGKTKAGSSPDAGTSFKEETAAAQREIDALRAKGINKIVLLSHLGYHHDKEIIGKLSGVNVVVGGDSHTLLGPDNLADYGLRLQGPYPTQLTNKDGKQVCLAHAWARSRVVGELKVSFDANGDVTGCAGTPHVLIGDDFTVAGAAASAAQKASILADVGASGFLRVTAPSPAATNVLQPFKDKVAILRGSMVATAPQELCTRRVPGGPATADYFRSSRACNAQGDVSWRGGDIQQLVAQAYLDVVNKNYGGADISLQSGGGVHRALSGDVTAANVIEVLPFDNMLWRLDVTGREVKNMLEDGVRATQPGARPGAYPYTGGLRFDVNARLAQGNRVANIEVFDAATGTWRVLDLTKSYKLVVSAFNAAGQDGYPTLGAVPAARRFELGVGDNEALQAYIDMQAKNPGTGLPAVLPLNAGLYSTKSYIEP